MSSDIPAAPGLATRPQTLTWAIGASAILGITGIVFLAIPEIRDELGGAGIGVGIAVSVVTFLFCWFQWQFKLWAAVGTTLVAAFQLFSILPAVTGEFTTLMTVLSLVLAPIAAVAIVYTWHPASRHAYRTGGA